MNCPDRTGLEKQEKMTIRPENLKTRHSIPMHNLTRQHVLVQNRVGILAGHNKHNQD